MSAKKIVVIDDDPDQQAGLQVRLTASGYDVSSARDAMQAIAVVRKVKPDLILLDIGLPGGDGHTVIARLKTLGPLASIPVIVLSAMEPADNVERMRAAGAVAYFQKPANNELLLAEIRKALGETVPQQ